MIVDASIDKLYEVLEFVEKKLLLVDCPLKVKNQLMIVVEEIFVNIAHYAYLENKNNCNTVEIELSLNFERREVEIKFIDEGKQYNPLSKQDPDITLSTDKRKIGGLGIFMVKNIMDKVDYQYKDNKNIFTIKKIIA